MPLENPKIYLLLRDPYSWIADLHRNLGNFSQAIEYKNHELQLIIKYTTTKYTLYAPYLNIGHIYFDQGNLSEASISYRQALIYLYQHPAGDFNKHPHYWTGFSLVGDPRPLKYLAPANERVLIPAIILVFSAIIILVFFKKRGSRSLIFRRSSHSVYPSQQPHNLKVWVSHFSMLPAFAF